MNDLTVSNIERQNVLNNKYAVAKIKDKLGVSAMDFDGQYLFTKKWWLIFMKLMYPRLIDICQNM